MEFTLTVDTEEGGCFAEERELQVRVVVVVVVVGIGERETESPRRGKNTGRQSPSSPPLFVVSRRGHEAFPRTQRIR